MALAPGGGATAAAGFAAAAAAPGLGAAGLYLWSGWWAGSAFALNLFKCTAASAVHVALAAGGASREAADGPGLARIPAETYGWLLASSVIGIVVGDNLWLLSLKLLGPRTVVFVNNLQPFLAALVGKFYLGEDISGWGLLLGVALTAAGVTLVSLEKTRAGAGDGDGTEAEEGAEEGPRKPSPLGWACAALNVSLDTLGAAITKKHAPGLTTWEINACRFGSAAVVLAAVSLLLQAYDGLRRGGRVRLRSDVKLKERGADGKFSDLAGEGEGEVPAVPEVEERAEAKFAWAAMPRGMPTKAWLLVTSGVAFTTFVCPALQSFSLFLISLPAWATLGALGCVGAGCSAFSLPKMGGAAGTDADRTAGRSMRSRSAGR